MSYVIAAPEMMTSAATDLATIGSNLSASHTAAAAQTTGMLAAAEDEVSTAIAALFSAHGQGFQALGAQAAAFQDQFVQNLIASANSYAAAETQAANTLTSLLKAPALPPVPANLHPGFTGTPSLLTRLENATVIKLIGDFFHLPVVDQQMATPGSPLRMFFADAPNIPGVNLLLSNTPPKILPLLLHETVTQTNYQGMPVVQIAPAHPSGDYVVAVHGGAGLLPPLVTAWINYSMMAYQTGATIQVPIYPLVSQGGTAPVMIPKMAGLIESQISAHGAPHVSVLGDSAGANFAMSSVEYLVTNGETVPHSMVLISPPVDATLSNPAIASVKGDWLPPASTIQQIDKQWANGLPLDNYMVSPLNGPLKGLPPTYVYQGSNDLVAPDVLRLEQAAIAQGAPISFVLLNGEVHDWMMLPETDTVTYWPQIHQELGLK